MYVSTYKRHGTKRYVRIGRFVVGFSGGGREGEERGGEGDVEGGLWLWLR